ncbi:MAG: ABC transporter permease [Flavobacteriales bacterium]|nr:ABC transporter permease [Flavobacteriales bacterium]
MRSLPHVIRKEFRQISRNKIMLPLLFVMPIVQLIVLSYAADFEVKNLNLAVIDHDRDPMSRALVDRFVASGYFTHVGQFQEVGAALEAIDREEADLVMTIPEDFSRSLRAGKPSNVQLLINAVNNQKASVANTYSQQVLALFNQERLFERFGGSAPGGLEISSAYWYNPKLNYKIFMVPGILAILVTMLTAFLSSINIIREREMGTIEQLNVSPLTKFEFILGKIIPFWIIGMVLMGFGLVVAYVLFGISTAGSTLLLFGFVSIYLVAILGFGILISTVTETQQQAMFITWFFLVIFLLLSGLFTPADNIPVWAKGINFFNPIKYFVEVMRMVMLKGSGWTDIRGHFAIIILFAIGFNFVAIRSYSKTTS